MSGSDCDSPQSGQATRSREVTRSLLPVAPGSGAVPRAGVAGAVRAGLTGNAQPLLQQRAGGRVLQMDLLAGAHVLLDRKGGEGRFVETGQDQFLLARIVVDVADCVDAGNIGLE